MTADGDLLEELLAEALAAFDDGGEDRLEQFVAAHPQQQTALRRGIERCRQMGMLGKGPAALRDFPERLGDFRLLQRLGGGGMGVVYEAEQLSLGRRVALKVIRPELLYFEGARERFRREVEAVARLSHPAVVPVLASGEQDGVPFYAMELLAGRTVADVCAALRDRNPAELLAAELRPLLLQAADAAAATTDPFTGSWWQLCVRVIHAVALGVRHAHLRGIVHRDIKPSNVMLTPHGQAVLLDFGVASVGGHAEFTRSGHTPGSPAFMSPEQLRGQAVDLRTDVYSLGATLWNMLALRPPFRGVDDLARIAAGDLPPLRAQHRGLPPELELVVRTAMDRDRDRRYPDMDAFAADLQAVLQRRPIRARRLGRGLRVWRWCQRHRVAATAAVALVLAAAALPLVLAWRTSAANVVLAAAKARADESLEQTLDALDKVLVRLGREQLLAVPAADAIALESLQEAMAMYRRLLPKHPDHVRLRQHAARALDSIAAAKERLGDVDGGVDDRREAIALLGDDRMDLPPEWIDGRAHVQQNLAGTLANQRLAAAAQAAIAAAERDFGAVAELEGYRTTSLRGRGELCIARTVLLADTDPECERLLRESIDLGRAQLELEPDNPETQAMLVRRLDNLATLLVRHKRADPAVPLLDEALQLARALPPDARIWYPPAEMVAMALETLGNLRVDRKDTSALALLRECLELRERTSRDHPYDLKLRCLLGNACHNLARALYRQERDAEALPLFDRAVALQTGVLAESPRLAMARDSLRATYNLRGSCLLQLHRLDDLIANAEAMATEADHTGALRTAARQLLRADELALVVARGDAAAAEPTQIRCARRALDLLQAAERIGWGTGNKFDDDVYQPLRDRPELAEEFEALQQRIAARLRPGR